MKKDHILKHKTCAGVPVPNDIYLTLFLMLWVTGKGLDEKKRHSGVHGYMLWYYSWAFVVWVRFLCNFPKIGKLQGTPELWMWTHRSPSTGSLAHFYLFPCFTVCFMSIAVLNCCYLLGVLQMKNGWWGQQRINPYRAGGVAMSTSTGNRTAEALAVTPGGAWEEAKRLGEKRGGWVMTEAHYCFLAKKQNFLIICQALPFQAEIHCYIKVNALLLTE